MTACRRPLYLFLSVAALSGCGTLWQTPAQNGWVNQSAEAHRSIAVTETKTTTELPSVAGLRSDSKPVNINIGRTLNQAIALLGKGKKEQAREKLYQVLAKDPDNANAFAFLEQIDIDPNLYFGDQYFEYQARRGDSMTRIADRFLKDHLKFYILSRYSGIENPASLVRGQVVRIPIQYKPQVTAKVRNTNSSAENADIKRAQSLLAQGLFVDAIQYLETVKSNPGSGSRLTALLEKAYAREAERLEDSGELESAIMLYKKAAKTASDRTAYSAQIAHLSDQLKAIDLQRLASLHLKSGQLDIAMKNIQDSLELMPDSDVSKSLYQRIRANLVSEYHEQALELFNEDRFEPALALWQKALALDPTHLLSKTYHERCIVVLERQQDIALSYTDDQ